MRVLSPLLPVLFIAFAAFVVLGLASHFLPAMDAVISAIYFSLIAKAFAFVAPKAPTIRAIAATKLGGYFMLIFALVYQLYAPPEFWPRVMSAVVVLALLVWIAFAARDVRQSINDLRGLK